MSKSTGASGYFTFNGTPIPFTTITPKVTRTMDDSTDSTNFDASSNIVHLSQLPASTQTSFQIEGKINLAVVPSSLVTPLYSGATAVPCAIGYNAGSIYGHGNCDITDFEGVIDPMKTLTYSATLITNGVFTPNS
jgi:hypothetical protein